MTLNYFDGLEESPRLAEIGKVKKRNPEKSRRSVLKSFRHSGGGKHPHIPCNHNPAMSFCKALALRVGKHCKELSEIL